MKTVRPFYFSFNLIRLYCSLRFGPFSVFVPYVQIFGVAETVLTKTTANCIRAVPMIVLTLSAALFEELLSPIYCFQASKQ